MTIAVLDALEMQLKDPTLLDQIGSLGVSLVQKNIETGPWVPNSPLSQDYKGNSKPLRDTGGLLNSIAHQVGSGVVFIGSNHIAARILHDGGTITPKRTRFLAVPLGAETRRFMRMYGHTPRSCIEGMKAAGYKIWVAKGVILAQKGKQGRVRALFVLKTSIRIPSRPFLRLPERSVRIIEQAVMRRLTS
jgi:phage gpG-like protein